MKCVMSFEKKNKENSRTEYKVQTYIHKILENDAVLKNFPVFTKINTAKKYEFEDA